MKQCPNCLHEEDDSYTYCSKCGTKLTETENEKAAEIKTEKKQKKTRTGILPKVLDALILTLSISYALMLGANHFYNWSSPITLPGMNVIKTSSVTTVTDEEESDSQTETEDNTDHSSEHHHSHGHGHSHSDSDDSEQRKF